MLVIQEICDKSRKKDIDRSVLSKLPKWFGIEESRKEYIRDSENQILFLASRHSKEIGFLCLKETGKDTVEIAVIGVLESFINLVLEEDYF